MSSEQNEEHPESSVPGGSSKGGNFDDDGLADLISKLTILTRKTSAGGQGIAPLMSPGITSNIASIFESQVEIGRQLCGTTDKDGGPLEVGREFKKLVDETKADTTIPDWKKWCVIDNFIYQRIEDIDADKAGNLMLSDDEDADSGEEEEAINSVEGSDKPDTSSIAAKKTTDDK